MPIRNFLPCVLAVFLLAVGQLPSAAQAHGYKLGELSVGHIWAPVPEDGATGLAVYGPILNSGAKPVHLEGASTPIAASAQFRMDSDGDTRWPAAIELQPGMPMALAAWREHIWLSGLNTTLKEGDSFALTLDFGEAGLLTVEVVVERIPGH